MPLMAALTSRIRFVAAQHPQCPSQLVGALAGESYPLEKAAEAVSASLRDARGPKVLLVG